ncbi:hypothetical protein K505DRAFT_287604 [Melanomma pulvis-pyrius CBS 109.77]|uniref:Uncharacterized protein n=1 Tax=Melanomma pulvis-pyrius CBS 109.77 TaxID=1314802 RepID=A0A6A6WU18_9PLEO|nr:hypothetical protein K505DRAFT_287604 [Melanomma pulvis-pyrius CBS 109.77]
MLFKSMLAVAFAGIASADWIILEPGQRMTFANSDELRKYQSSVSAKLPAIESAYSTYITHLQQEPQYISAKSAFEEFVATRTDAPKAVLTATDTVTQYSTTPGWYKALPTDQQQYYASIADDMNALASSVLSDKAPRPTAMAKYVGAAAAAAGAVAVLL